MTMNRIKLIVTAIILLPALAIAAFQNNAAVIGTPVADDTEAVYKAKCQMCHTATAAKSFDPAKDDAALVQTVLKGKADSKPAMPAYETKGITEEQAKALVAHMKKLRAPAN